MILGKRSKIADLEGCDGICLFAQRAIVIADDISKEMFRPTLMHEIVHAVVYMFGLEGAIGMMTGLNAEKMASLEEILASTLGQAIYDTLERNGWLHMPPIPERD